MTEAHSTPAAHPVAHASHGGHGLREPTFTTYMIVFGALAIFTTLSFIFNWAARHEIISTWASFGLILGVAVIKAVIVAVYFMHLIIDWEKLYYMIIPTIILGVMMMIVLMPDTVLGWWAIARQAAAVPAVATPAPAAPQH